MPFVILAVIFVAGIVIGEIMRPKHPFELSEYEPLEEEGAIADY